MFKQYLFGTKGDMVERGLILASIVAVAIAIWVTLGQKLANKLSQVNNAIN